jgi:hypothetical protein
VKKGTRPFLIHLNRFPALSFRGNVARGSPPPARFCRFHLHSMNIESDRRALLLALRLLAGTAAPTVSTCNCTSHEANEHRLHDKVYIAITRQTALCRSSTATLPSSVGLLLSTTNSPKIEDEHLLDTFLLFPHSEGIPSRCSSRMAVTREKDAASFRRTHQPETIAAS